MSSDKSSGNPEGLRYCSFHGDLEQRLRKFRTLQHGDNVATKAINQSTSDQEKTGTFLLGEKRIKELARFTSKRLFEHYAFLRYTSHLCLPPLSEIFLDRCLKKVIIHVLKDEPAIIDVSRAKILGSKLYWLFVSFGLCQYLRNVHPDVVFINASLDTLDYFESPTQFAQKFVDKDKSEVLIYTNAYKDKTRSEYFVDLFSLHSATQVVQAFTNLTSKYQDNETQIDEQEFYYTDIDDDVVMELQSYDIDPDKIKNIGDEMYNKILRSYKLDNGYDFVDYVASKKFLKEVIVSNSTISQDITRQAASVKVGELFGKFQFLKHYFPTFEELESYSIDDKVISYKDYIISMHMFVLLKNYIWKKHWVDTIKRRLVIGINSSALPEEFKDCDEYWVFGDPKESARIKELEKVVVSQLQGSKNKEDVKMKDIESKTEKEEGKDVNSSKSVRILPIIHIHKEREFSQTETPTFFNIETERDFKPSSSSSSSSSSNYFEDEIAEDVNTTLLIPIRNYTAIRNFPWLIPDGNKYNALIENRLNGQDFISPYNVSSFHATIIPSVHFSVQKEIIPQLFANVCCWIEEIYHHIKPEDKEQKRKMASGLDSLHKVVDFYERYQSIATSSKSNVYMEYMFDYRLNSLNYNFDSLFTDVNPGIYRYHILKSFDGGILQLLKNNKDLLKYLKEKQQEKTSLKFEDVEAKLLSIRNRLLFVVDLLENYFNATRGLKNLTAYGDYITTCQPFLLFDRHLQHGYKKEYKMLDIEIELGEHNTSGTLEVDESSERCAFGGKACNIKAVLRIPSTLMRNINSHTTMEKIPSTNSSKRDTVWSRHTNEDGNFRYVRVVFCDSETDEGKKCIEETDITSKKQHDEYISKASTTINTPDTRDIFLIFPKTKTPHFFKEDKYHNSTIKNLLDKFARVSWSLDVSEIKETYATKSSHVVHHVGIGNLVLMISAPIMALIYDSYRNSELHGKGDINIDYTTTRQKEAHFRGKDFRRFAASSPMNKGPAFQFEEMLFTGSFNAHTPDDPLNYHTLMMNYLKSKYMQLMYRRHVKKIQRILDMKRVQSNNDRENNFMQTLDPESQERRSVQSLESEQHRFQDLTKTFDRSCTCLANTLNQICTLNPTDWIFADRFVDNFGNVDAFSLTNGPNLTSQMDDIGKFYHSVSILNKVKEDISKLAGTSLKPEDIDISREVIMKTIKKTFDPYRDYYTRKLSILRTGDKESMDMSIFTHSGEGREFNLQRDRDERDQRVGGYRIRDERDIRSHENMDGTDYKRLLSIRMSYTNDESRRIYTTYKSAEEYVDEKAQSLFSKAFTSFINYTITPKSGLPSSGKTEVEKRIDLMGESEYRQAILDSRSVISPSFRDINDNTAAFDTFSSNPIPIPFMKEYRNVRGELFPKFGGEREMGLHSETRTIKDYSQLEFSQSAMVQLSRNLSGTQNELVAELERNNTLDWYNQFQAFQKYQQIQQQTE